MTSSVETRFIRTILFVTIVTATENPLASAQDRSLRDNPELAAYFEEEVRRIEQESELSQHQSLAEWEAAKPQLREQLFDMLGLSPRPVKTELQATVTGTVESDEFIIEKVHFQSQPGLYVTGNFYKPRSFDGRLPTILYVCGHGQVKKHGISFGNKAHYHYHGSWFARNGYCCLTIDTLQLGEIEGIHHGTYRENRWWWNSRGYTPAGVEAWNCIRALDYLETRPEVDTTRIGVTGRSGGGAYSWWISALDDRITCSVPVAGITNLRDHVINGCVEGHCDCMFMVNTQRWDYATVAALVAPRPLLISNTDKDAIFPLEGVVDIHRQVRHIYQLYNAGDKLGLQITEGPHEDTQELHIHAFRWFNRFLKSDKSMIDKTAVTFFPPEQLRVFLQNPADEINSRIDELFVAPAAAASQESILNEQNNVLHDRNDWSNRRLDQLRERCFRAWPEGEDDLSLKPDDLMPVGDAPAASVTSSTKRLVARFESQPHVPLKLDVVLLSDDAPEQIRSIRLVVVQRSDQAQPECSPATGEACLAFVPRGIGENAWKGNAAKQTQIRRRFQLIGTTLETMQIWDIRRAIHAARLLFPKSTQFAVHCDDIELSPLILIATIYEPPIDISVREISSDPAVWPSILNLTRTIAPEEIAALAASRHNLQIQPNPADMKVYDFIERLKKDPRWNGVQPPQSQK
ncbi:MAG: alpha/beta hydrolase family protein [Planctomycetota bacterium]